LLALVSSFGTLAAQETDQPIDAAVQAALESGQWQRAMSLVNRAIERQPGNPRLILLRASVYEAGQQFAPAIADYTRLLSAPGVPLAPNTAADIHDRRGSAHFCAGGVRESVSDFDRAIQLDPRREPGHWKRGIAYYYLGRWEDGCRQFAAYQTVDANDVENAVWWFLCKAKAESLEAARQGILKVGADRRVPMAQIYELFQERADAEQVLDAAREGSPPAEELKTRLFHAHLYLGLWHEINGRPEQSLAQIRQAVEDFDVGGYMGQVARVHLALRMSAESRR
jgi:lipoprotein NlpI